MTQRQPSLQQRLELGLPPSIEGPLSAWGKWANNGGRAMVCGDLLLATGAH